MIQQKVAEIPDTRDLSRLPVLALTAMAVRSARRALPWARARDRHVVDEAIEIAERFARGDLKLARAASAAAAVAGERASEAHREGHETAETDFDSAGAFLASAAATAAAYVAHAVEVAAEEARREVPEIVHAAVQAACYVDHRAIAEVTADYLRLRDLNLGHYPELGPAIDPGENGPLGPLWGEEAS